MDAREREDSQSRRSSIKRPWDEDATLPDQSNGWNGSILPPIDGAPYRRPSIHLGGEPGAGPHSRYGSVLRESAAKKARYEGNHDYNTPPLGDLNLNGNSHLSRVSSSAYPPHRRPLESPNFGQTHQGGGFYRQAGEVGGPAGLQDASNLCPRCRRLTTPHPDLSFVESCEDCNRNPELHKLTQAMHAGLTQLASSLYQRGIEHSQHEFESADCPPIEQYGLKQTLSWILRRIHLVNELADNLVQHDPRSAFRKLERNSHIDVIDSQDGLDDIMKRRRDADSDDTFRTRGDAMDPASDSKLHTRRKSMATAMTGSEELPPIRSQHDYHSSHPLDGPTRRASIMDPPPAPNRQLPSPPGRSLPSPTSLNFPSPSAASYGGASQSVNLPPPSSLQHSSLGNYLPPLGTAHSSDSALQAHSAALQHEVSVQKIALSSLQGEHDKLLAAFSRSQTRASALEKKHAVSDSEIISLTEEKLRLQAQVIELERDVEELSRSRDNFRQAAVQEGAQYVEIVKKASRLEEMAGEERKSWNKLKTEMEHRIESLSARSSRMDGTMSTADATLLPQLVDGVDTPASSIEGPSDLKIEPTSESRSVGPTSDPSKPPQDSTKHLKEEITRLRNRCTEVEDALRSVREESRSVEGIVEALGLAGRSILEQADKALRNVLEE